MSLLEELEKIPIDVVKAIAPQEWLRAAWDAAVSDIVCGHANVVGTKNGVWLVHCESLETLHSLHGHGEIIARLHHVHEIRELPPLRTLALLPPDNFCSPFALIKKNLVMQMPAHQWIKYAYQLSVDNITAQTSTVIAIDNGTYHIRCDSDHAYRALQCPETLIGMFYWLSHKYRPLPPMTQIKLSLGQFKNEEKK